MYFKINAGTYDMLVAEGFWPSEIELQIRQVNAPADVESHPDEDRRGATRMEDLADQIVHAHP